MRTYSSVWGTSRFSSAPAPDQSGFSASLFHAFVGKPISAARLFFAFLTDGICPQQFEELSSLMDERKCDIAQLY
jgi:hypothetical protein